MDRTLFWIEKNCEDNYEVLYLGSWILYAKGWARLDFPDRLQLDARQATCPCRLLRAYT